MIDSRLFSFLGKGSSLHALHIETFCPHQVSWSGGDINVFEWVFGEATVKERKCQDTCGSDHCVTTSTLLLKVIPWGRTGVRG